MSQPTAGSKITIVNGAVAAGTTAVTGASVIDMSDYESCRFIFEFGAITAGQACKCIIAQSNTNPPLTDGTQDAAGSGTTFSDTASTNTGVIIEVQKPLFRYLLAYINRTSQNVAVNSITAIQAGPKKLPVTQDAVSIAKTTKVISPAVGTA